MRDMNSSRRHFFGTAAASTAAASFLPLHAAATGDASSGTVKLGVASYSLREFQRPLAIAMTKKLGVSLINIKEVHLLYRATPEERARGRKQFLDAGLTITGGGTIYMQKEDDADIKFYFDYAKDCGMPLMVIGATHKTLPMIEKFVKQYDIKVAVHNHGPEDKYFPSGTDVLPVIRNMDPRVGVCLDIGHETRIGRNIMESLEACGPRLLDMHIKDLKVLTDGKSQVPVGEGSMPIPQIFKTLMKMNFAGTVNLEYEIEAQAPLEGMMKSFSYMRGVLAGLRG